jgi:hypothetical protein
MTYTKPAVTLRPRSAVGSIVDDYNQIADSLIPFMTDPASLDASQANPADNVNQTVGGGFSTSSADFQTVAGVCKPMNFPALNAVRVFQGQLNRVAQMKGYGKIADDGAVGPATLTLFRQVQSAAGGSVMGDGSSCMGVAPDVDVLAAQIGAFADSLGAPPVVAAAASFKAPTILTKSGASIVAPDAGIAGELAKLSGIEKMALLGVGGAILYLTFGKKKRRK